MNGIRLRPIGLSLVRMTVVCVPFIAALAMLGLSAEATADEVLVVSPPGLDNVEGNLRRLSNPPPSTGARFQNLYFASDFSGLPEGHNTIVSMAWRPDFTVTNDIEVTFDLELRLSTAAPGTLSSTFATNIGNDETLVYSGSITLQTDGAGGPPGGPRPFDYLFEFQTPFIYDPNQGNLLVDHTFFPPIPGAPAIDVQSMGGTHWVFGSHAGAATATIRDSSLPVTQFAVVPEPSMFVLAALALVGLRAGRRKQR